MHCVLIAFDKVFNTPIFWGINDTGTPFVLFDIPSRIPSAIMPISRIAETLEVHQKSINFNQPITIIEMVIGS